MILVIPASILARVIKRIEGVDEYDYSTNFNPFKIGLSNDKTVSQGKLAQELNG